jgi:hypothetical protein
MQTHAQFKVELDRSEEFMAMSLEGDPTNLFSLLGELNGLLQENNVETAKDFIVNTQDGLAVSKTIGILPT